MGRGAGGGSRGIDSGVTRGVSWRSVTGSSTIAKEKFDGAPQEHMDAVPDVRLYNGSPIPPTGGTVTGYYNAFEDPNVLHIRRDASPFTNRHELAHYVEAQLLPLERRRELGVLFNREMDRTDRLVASGGTAALNFHWISEYAGKNPHEMFAETYAMLTMPGAAGRTNNRRRLEANAPDVLAFVESFL